MDRKAIFAVVLMMAIAIAPAVLFKQPPKRPAAGADSTSHLAPAAPSAPESSLALPPGAVSAAPGADSMMPPARIDTVQVTSPLYDYAVSTQGGRLVDARLLKYPSLVKGDHREPVQLLDHGSNLLGLTLIAGRDTIRLSDWVFTPSATSLTATADGAPLTLTASRGGLGVTLTYRFSPTDYQVAVTGDVTGLGPDGGLLLVGMGPGLRNTEADSMENIRALSLVTKSTGTEAHRLAKFKPGEPGTISGPFEWAALKSKYFVTAVLALDSTSGHIAGISYAAEPPTGKEVTRANLELSLPVAAAGHFSYTVYAGPMEYARLKAIGHDFDDVNPYGWPGFRTLIRVIAIPVRWLLLWMHDNLHLTYGLVLIAFGILIRLVLWPLNQKAMRANIKLQQVQPLMKDLQDRHKNDPQKLQQEMFKLYKEHNVNPLGGCWPMLLPMPVLFALFFVFQYSIELRGAPFLWIPDLAAPDPFYIIPLVMGGSMFWLSKVGQAGMEPNPQMKTMLYVMPAMMTVLFLKFPAGLNLYYAVSNLASVPQQWMLARERLKKNPPPPPPAKAQPKGKKAA